MSTIEVYGSYGTLTVHRTSGHILGYIPEPGDTPEYSDIRWFDPATLPEQACCDILGTGFAADTGYCRELTWLGPEQYWVDQLRLPAPKVSIILHGWHWDAYWDARIGDLVTTQEHADEQPDKEPDGWCVYTRHDPENTHHPFDLSNEQDFATYEEALAEAQTRAAEYGIEHRED